MINKEKLIEILQENDVGISNNGNICLYDFVENIVESKNPSLYIKRLEYDLIDAKGKNYISQDDCIDILKNTKFKKCKDIYTKIQFDDEDGTSIIDVENQIFQFEGHKFMAFFVNKEEEGDWDVWVKGSDIAKYLGYLNPSEALHYNVDVNNIMTFKLLTTNYDLVIKNIDKNTIY